MKTIPLAALLVLAACGSENDAPPAPVTPEWSCAGGTVSCPNADSVTQVPNAWSPYTVCEWNCATWNGKTGHVYAALDPYCPAGGTCSCDFAIEVTVPGGCG